MIRGHIRGFGARSHASLVITAVKSGFFHSAKPDQSPQLCSESFPSWLSSRRGRRNELSTCLHAVPSSIPAAEEVCLLPNVWWRAQDRILDLTSNSGAEHCRR